MEDLSIYAGKRVLITGHTGFKGAWLALWLLELGAEVIGYSLAPPTTPNLFTLAELNEQMTHILGDVRDLPKLKEAFAIYRPQVVFHLAAQALVLPSYAEPLATFETNALGTLHLLEAARTCSSLEALVLITTDKCYDNVGSPWGYRETDALGGKDPYSASKAMAELAIQAYRSSYFTDLPVASARAGNVIGGGDFAAHRILPDTLKALTQGKPVEVRNPASVRPWLSVFDALNGYLTLGAHLLQKGTCISGAWNFGPLERCGISVQDLVEKTCELWGGGSWTIPENVSQLPEMPTLRLNWDRAAAQLKWEPLFTWQQAVAHAVAWTKAYVAQTDVAEISKEHLRVYCNAKQKRVHAIY